MSNTEIGQLREINKNLGVISRQINEFRKELSEFFIQNKESIQLLYDIKNNIS